MLLPLPSYWLKHIKAGVGGQTPDALSVCLNYSAEFDFQVD